MKKIILFSLILTAISTAFASAYTVVDFEDYQKELAKQNVKDAIQVTTEFKRVRNISCKYKESGDYYIMRPICLRKRQYPKLGFRETVDILRPYIKGFDQAYNQDASEFVFKSAKPDMDYTDLTINDEYHNTVKQKQLINELSKRRVYIRIHKKYLAKYSAEDFQYYPTIKETKNMGPCTKTNYEVSAGPLNWLYIKPGEIFNLNQAISRLPGYCAGINGNQVLPFYGGSCGTAGQLFRTTLMVPDITVTKRSPHIRRWAQFYGLTVYGDDAAVLTDVKQLEIRNDGSFPIYFKQLKFDDYTYLVAIKPVDQDKKVKIQKFQTWPLSAKVIKTTFDIKDDKVLNIDEFYSQYYQYFNGGV